MYFEWRWQSDFGVSILVTTYLLVHVVIAVTIGGAHALWTVVIASDRCAFDLPPFRRCVEDFSWSPFLPTVFEVSLVRKLVAVIVWGLLLYKEINFCMKRAAFFSHSNRMTAYLCRSVSFAFLTNYFSISFLKYKVWSRTIVIFDDK